MSPLLTQSTVPASAAILQIADSAGASADTQMQQRAFVSLNAAIKHFNNKANWDWLRTEANPITVFAPFGFVVASASSGETSALVPAGHGLLVDDFIGGIPFYAGTRVSATAAGNIGFNYAVSSSIGAGVQSFSATAVRDMYDLPTDWKAEYSIRLLGAQRVLYPTVRRVYDRSITSEQSPTTPGGYDLFLVGTRSKIRLLYPPSGQDILQLRYYRRIATASASGSTATLDILEDYDPYLIAYGKWHFLTDKTEGRGDQANVWLTFANDGLMTMLKDQTRKPDEDLGFVPGAARGWPGDNDTRWIMESMAGV
jgi:hypothetical protein